MESLKFHANIKASGEVESLIMSSLNIGILVTGVNFPILYFEESVTASKIELFILQNVKKVFDLAAAPTPTNKS